MRIHCVALAAASFSVGESFIPSIARNRVVVAGWSKKIQITDWAENLNGGVLSKGGQYISESDLQAEAKSKAEAEAASSRQTFRPLELFVKAGPSGDDVGDCPFAHSVRMVLSAKGIECITTPCTPTSKPDWLADGFDGKMPCLLHDGEAIVESASIARYLDFFFPSTPLAHSSPEVEAATGLLFPAVAAYLKAPDGNDAAELAALDAVLTSLSEFLRGSAGEFLGGATSLGLGDCALAPQLYHLQVAGKHFKNYEVKKII
jgi:glutathione S-transferase